MVIIDPTNCQENQVVSAYLNEVVTFGTPIKQVNYFDVKQSIQNGGGTACISLLATMNNMEFTAVKQNTIMNNTLFTRLNTLVDKNYLDRFSYYDLANPQMLIDLRTALDELKQIMKLGNVYLLHK